ncbi:AAA family ATPase [Aeromonas veronii]
MKITKITINSIRRLNVNINNSLEELCFGEKINILIGENGSGKSTIIDMIHSLKK